MVRDQADKDSDAHKCDQEGHRGDEHALPRAVGDGSANQESQPGQMQQDEQQDDDQAGKRQQQKRSGSGHTLLNHCKAPFPTTKCGRAKSSSSVSLVTILLYSAELHWIRRRDPAIGPVQTYGSGSCSQLGQCLMQVGAAAQI
jgi:hypothetical protein